MMRRLRRVRHGDEILVVEGDDGYSETIATCYSQVQAERIIDALQAPRPESAVIATLKAALAPFARFGHRETQHEAGYDGGVWKNAPMRERIKDWFGPSEFRAAADALPNEEAGDP